MDSQRTVRLTGADETSSCPLTAQWYLPASSLLAWKLVPQTRYPSLNQMISVGLGQPDMQVSLTVSPSITVLGCTTATSSTPENQNTSIFTSSSSFRQEGIFAYLLWCHYLLPSEKHNFYFSSCWMLLQNENNMFLYLRVEHHSPAVCSHPGNYRGI